MTTENEQNAPQEDDPSDGSDLVNGRVGRRIPEDSLKPAGFQDKIEGATWRGWLLGLLTVAGLCVFVPYADFVFRGSTLSWSAFPLFPVAFLFVVVLVSQGILPSLGVRIGLTRQDLTLVFCMTMVMYAVPGAGFWTFWSTQMTAADHLATRDNGYEDSLQAHMREDLFVRDPADPEASGPRPVEWFYSGLPEGAKIPWGAWIGPYLRWMIVVACMYGLYFAIAGLLSRRWSDQERLTFPVAQVPEEILSGHSSQDPSHKPIFRDKLFVRGILVTFILQSYNVLHTFSPRFPSLPMRNWNLNGKYFTEVPWVHIGGLHVHFFPTIIGLTFLLSKEVAFSLWFFYVLQKVINIQIVPFVGRQVVNESYVSQGTGALFAVVLMGLWGARGHLGASLKQAIGLEHRENPEGDPSPRLLWLVFAISFVGAISWLTWAGVDFIWAISILILFLIVMIGMARLMCEAGIVAAQFYDFPVYMLGYVATPAGIGAPDMVLMRTYNRIFTADWFRIVPLPNIMNALHLAGQTGMRRLTVMGGMAGALILTFTLSFATVLYANYTSGGVRDFGYFYERQPNADMKLAANESAAIAAWEKRVEKAEETGEPIPQKNVSKVAQVRMDKAVWSSVGGIVMASIIIARRYVFWIPHPAGYVMWMASFPISCLWMSFFLGWFCKWAITKYGGMRVYGLARRFFIGLIVGEALAAVFWVIVYMIFGIVGGHAIWIS